MEFYFNELSLKNLQENYIYLFENLAHVIKKISSLGIDVEINYHKQTETILQNQNFLEFIYSIPEKQGGIKSYLAAKFIRQSINTVYPEYKFQDSECYGLGLAYENKCISISLQSNTIWEQNLIEINRIIFDDTSNNIDEKSINAKNISVPNNIDFHKFFIESYIENKKKEAKLNIVSGRDLLSKQTLFENLIFCDEIHDYLNNHLTSNTPELSDLLNKLISINTFFQNEYIKPEEIKSKVLGRPRQEFENRRRLIDEKIKIEFSDNIKRDFYWHIDTYNSNGRIHFSPDFKNKKCYIGYIGPKIV